jgi:hypothetical protein
MNRESHVKAQAMRPIGLPDLLAGVVSLAVVLFLWLQ